MLPREANKSPAPHRKRNVPMNQKAVRPRTAPQRAAAVTSEVPVIPTSDWTPRRTGGVVMPTTFCRSTNFRMASIVFPGKDSRKRAASGAKTVHCGAAAAIARTTKEKARVNVHAPSQEMTTASPSQDREGDNWETIPCEGTTFIKYKYIYVLWYYISK